MVPYVWVVFSALGACANRVQMQQDLTRSGKHLPIPASMYPKGCPFQSWYSALPDQFEDWEKALVQKYKDTWKSNGSPKGVNENDHNYNTLLGQGNTLGFVAAKLTLHPEIPEDLKFGLFAEAGTIPAIVRLSDFGDDASDIRFGRVAVKLPLASAWGGEANLLFTETMDAFPIANFGQLAVFAGDVENKLKAAGLVKNAISILGIQNFKQVVGGEAFKEQLLAKRYYSQLPYQLGDAGAMKFSLVPMQQTCSKTLTECCVPATEKMGPGFAADRQAGTQKYLADCAAKFDLQLQVKKFSEKFRRVLNNNTIFHGGSESWKETPFSVGTLTIPPQTCTDRAVATDLQSKLASILNVEPEGIDKMFAFHPIQNHHDNRPIGDVNTFRAAFYSQHATARYDTIQNGIFQGANGPLRTVEQMPFDQLTEMFDAL